MPDGVIDLYQQLNILWRKKVIIALITTVVTAVAIIIGMSLTPIYRISAAVSPGWLNEKDGVITYIDSVENVASTVKSQGFHYDVIRNLKLDLKEYGSIQYFVSNPKKSKYLNISIDFDDVDKGKMILQTALNQLQLNYEDRVSLRKRILSGEIENTKQKINALEKKIDVSGSKIKIYKKDMKRLQDDIVVVRRNTDKIVNFRSEILSQKKNIEPLSLLLYSNSIQQNIAYLENLETKFKLMAVEIEKENGQIKQFEIAVEKERNNINILEVQRDMIEGIVVVQTPESSVHPVKPNMRLMALVAFFLSLFSSILGVLFLDWLKGHQNANNSK